MAKISRVLYKLFGSGGVTNDFGKFGSQEAGSPVKTKDLDNIQALSAWLNGWADAINTANKAPFLEDLNALCLVLSSGIKYLYQEGIPEYLSTETYYTQSIVKKVGTGELYMSRIDNNTGNALPVKVTDTNWRYLLDLADPLPDGSIVPAKVSNVFGTNAPKSAGTVYTPTRDGHAYGWMEGTGTYKQIAAAFMIDGATAGYIDYLQSTYPVSFMKIPFSFPVTKGHTYQLLVSIGTPYLFFQEIGA